MSARPPIPPGNIRGIVQAAHGFSLAQILRFNGTSYVLAKADTAANAETPGIVSHVWDANRFTLLFFGYIPGGLSGLTSAQVYFLSPTTAGALTATEPSTAGQISKPLLIADSATSGFFFDWRGMTIPAPITTMTLNPLMIGTDMRLSSISGGGKLETRNPATNTWVTNAQWTNP
jgi:hypothetical protein